MRDDEDEGYGRGMSFTDGYIFGQMAAESSQRTLELKEHVRQRFARPQRTPYNADAVDRAIAAWKSAVRERDDDIERLQLLNRELKAGAASAVADAEALKRQLSAIGEENRALRGLVTNHEHDIELLQNTITRVMEMHDAELTELRAEIAGLKGES
ncbi:hypothetical protein GXW71_30155 [Roseomonas hellenica]|uniref:KfrA N-terminal DNA-binding domain-containing protein n=1 Tax=Plastoroseomonas hellenica TaxID=2687306 RepID=A0ABS5F7W3_9PROT|nr:hypothetical protein [Plastoroseomonas hellenica]MBR0668653.1 hypothetical protein [Plastoroseomonas hellenica]